jgi:hypothetical protein
MRRTIKNPESHDRRKSFEYGMVWDYINHRDRYKVSSKKRGCSQLANQVSSKKRGCSQLANQVPSKKRGCSQLANQVPSKKRGFRGV